jgi:hypothetical protein
MPRCGILRYGIACAIAIPVPKLLACFLFSNSCAKNQNAILAFVALHFK